MSGFCYSMYAGLVLVLCSSGYENRRGRSNDSHGFDRPAENSIESRELGNNIKLTVPHFTVRVDDTTGLLGRQVVQLGAVVLRHDAGRVVFLLVS